MERNKFYLLAIFCLMLTAVLGSKDDQMKAKPRKERQHAAQGSPKADVPTAEQILGKLLGVKSKPPDQTQAIVTAPQSIPYNPPPPSTSQARSPYKTIFNNIPLIPQRAATPQTEDNPGAAAYAGGQVPLTLPPPPPGYHYGRPRRKHRYDDDEEYPKDDGREDEDEGDEQEEENPADEEYHDQRNGLGRRRGRGRGLGRNLEQCLNRKQSCCNICWKGIKPHVEWVKVPVCYQPCGVCCPKHEEQPACACICHPCCHCCHCCHCCCHHPCHCCHCCHCCKRSQTWRPPLAPIKRKGQKMRENSKKTKKSKTKL